MLRINDVALRTKDMILPINDVALRTKDMILRINDVALRANRLTILRFRDTIKAV